MPITSPVKQKIKSGRPFLMAFLTTTDAATAEVMAMSGVDVVVVDNEHMPMTDEQLVNIARAVTMHGKAALLRTACKQPELLSRWMEFGFSGLCATQCGGYEDALIAVDAVKYPPIGKRGLGTDGRAAGYGFLGGMTPLEYMKQANEDTILFVTLENMSGVNDGVKIASLPEVDSVHIGPIDLAASMGFGGDSRAPEVVEVVSSAYAAMKKVGNIGACFVSSPEEIEKAISAGEKCLVVETDLTQLRRFYSSLSQSVSRSLGAKD